MKKTKDAIKRQLKEQWEQACGGFLVELLRMWELDATEFGFATPNLRSFVRGCPRTPAETFQHLRELKATLNDAIRDEKQRMKNGKQNNPY